MRRSRCYRHHAWGVDQRLDVDPLERRVRVALQRRDVAVDGVDPDDRLPVQDLRLGGSGGAREAWVIRRDTLHETGPLAGRVAHRGVEVVELSSRYRQRGRALEGYLAVV